MKIIFVGNMTKSAASLMKKAHSVGFECAHSDHADTSSFAGAHVVVAPSQAASQVSETFVASIEAAMSANRISRIIFTLEDSLDDTSQITKNLSRTNSDWTVVHSLAHTTKNMSQKLLAHITDSRYLRQAVRLA